MNIDSEELKTFVDSALATIKAEVGDSKGFVIRDTVEFDLAVTNTQEGGGKLKILVAGAEGKLKSESVSRIKFKVGRISTASVLSPSARRSNIGL